MAVSLRELGHVAVLPETQVPADNHEIILYDPARDYVGTPDFAALAKETRLKNGYALYRGAGGRFSADLHKFLIAGIEKLNEPGEREKSKFHAPTIAQAKNFEYRHNNPLDTDLPPEQQITLTQEQIDAYCMLRENRLEIPNEDRQNASNPAQFSDESLIREILKMPLLNSQEKRLQAFVTAA